MCIRQYGDSVALKCVSASSVGPLLSLSAAVFLHAAVGDRQCVVHVKSKDYNDLFSQMSGHKYGHSEILPGCNSYGLMHTSWRHAPHISPRPRRPLPAPPWTSKL